MSGRDTVRRIMPFRYKTSLPVLPSLDIEKTLALFRELGFAEAFRWGDPAEYAGVVAGDVRIHFWVCGDKTIPENSSVRLEVTDGR